MKEENAKTNDNLISEDVEIVLKQEIKFIQEEYKNKIEEHKKIKEELKKVKKSFRNGLKDYTTEKKLTIEKEQEIEILLSKISKMRKMMLLSTNQTINKKLYAHLLEISNNKQKENILLNFFNFLFNVYNYSKKYINTNNNNFFMSNDTFNKTVNNDNIFNNFSIIDKTQSIKELLTIIRNETEIRYILFYSYDIFHNLQEENNDVYLNIKNSFFQLYNEINNKEREYPFDFLFDFMKNIFTIIDYEKQVDVLKESLNKLIQEKNAKFVEVKNIESIIKTYNKNNKIISNYIKALKNFYYRIKEQNKNNDKNNSVNNNTNIIKNNNDGLKELIDDIKKFKKITLDYDKINSNFDVMTSLSFGTNYTLSEKSSIKSSSIFEFKNNNIDNENISDFNCNINEVINKDENVNMNINIDKKKNSNNNLAKKDNIALNNINNIQKKLVGNKTLNLKINNILNNNELFKKRKNQTMKRKICINKNNIGNLTAITDCNFHNRINMNNKVHSKSPIINYNINRRKIYQNKNNSSYTKENKDKNKKILSKPKIYDNNSKKNIPVKTIPQKFFNKDKDIRKKFNTNNIKKNCNKIRKISPNIKTNVNPSIRNNYNTQFFESKDIKLKNKQKLKKIENLEQKNEKENKSENKIEIKCESRNENKTEKDNNSSPKQTLKLFDGNENMENNITEKELDNDKLLFLNQNQKFDYQGNNRYNISKKIIQLKQKEQEESIEITMPNKENNLNDDFFDSNNIKDSICDEMISQNFGTANSVIRSTTNDYINKLGFKNNVLWSENLYKNKNNKFKSNFKKLNIEKPIDTSTCCAACT